MGIGSAKRTATRADQTPVKARRSNSRAIKSEGSPTPTPRSSSRKRNSATNSGRESFTSSLPTEQQRRSNGRVPGRNLIVWGRPRMAEKLLLHLQYECARHKVNIPWDAIAHRLHPGSSGAAVMQHLNRLRRELIAEGHLVPPVPSRPAAGESSDLEIRGYVRDDANGNDRETTRPVRFDEPMDDRKFSLPDSFVEDGDETGRVTPIRDGSEDEGNAELDSPTPLGRSYRHMSSARPTAKTEPNGSSLYPVPPGTSAVDHGTTPLDEDVSLYTSPQARRDRGHDDENGTGACHGLFDGSLYPPFTHFRAPPGADRHHPAYTYGDPFEAAGAHSQPNCENSGMKYPHEFYPHFPYGFTPWQMGYPIPPPYYPLPGHGRYGETPGDAAGSSSSTELKIEPSRAETLSSSATPPNEPQIEDLINENAGEIIEDVKTVDPAKTINV